MATIETRKNDNGTTSYRVKIRLRGRTESKTFVRKTDAKQWAESRQTAIRNGEAFGTTRKTVGEAIDRYLREELPKLAATLRKGRTLHLEWWRGELGADTPLVEIQRPLVHAALQERREGRTFATINRYRAALGALLSCAVEDWHWLPSHPLRSGGRRKRAKGDREEERDRVLTLEERERFWAACQVSRNRLLYPLVILAYYSGARQNELVTLEWGQVELYPKVRDVRSGESVDGVPIARIVDTKNGTDRTLYFPGPAAEVLRALGETKKRHVFQALGSPPIFPKEAFRSARERAGINGFRFHDLRHCWACNLAEEGATLLDLMTLGGWKSPSMVRRYASKAHAEGGASLGLMERMGKR